MKCRKRNFSPGSTRSRAIAFSACALAVLKTTDGASLRVGIVDRDLREALRGKTIRGRELPSCQLKNFLIAEDPYD